MAPTADCIALIAIAIVAHSSVVQEEVVEEVATAADKNKPPDYSGVCFFISLGGMQATFLSAPAWLRSSGVIRLRLALAVAFGNTKPPELRQLPQEK